MRCCRRILMSCLGVACIGAVVQAEADSNPRGWQTDFAQAEEQAERLARPLLIHFHAAWCGPCRQMERDVLSTPEVQQQLQTTVVGLKVDSDAHPELVERFRVRALPCDIFVHPNGKELTRLEGYCDRKRYLGRIARISAQVEQSKKIHIAKSKESKEATESGEGSRSDGAQSKDSEPDNSVSQSAESEAKESADEPLSENEEQSREDEAPSVPVEEKLPVQPQTTIGLGGYSPVSLWNWRQWRKGQQYFWAKYKGIVYFLANERELRQFQANPQKFAPALLGCDPVLLQTTHRVIAGSIQYGAYYNGELYLFVSQESRTQFKKNPKLYTHTQTRHALRADQVERRQVQ